MVRLTKNSSGLILAVLIAITFSGEAQAWTPSTNLGQIKIWLLIGNLNGFLNQQLPLHFTVVAAFYQNAPNGQTNFDIWIIVQVSKKHTKICHVRGYKPKKYAYIEVTWVKCYKCKKSKKHHSSSHSHSSHSSHSSSSSLSSDKKC